jgi:hypothetical protein
MPYYPPHSESVRLRMRRAHAKRAYYCTCGKIVHGNGGRASHFDMHERRGDGHHRISGSHWNELFREESEGRSG